MLAKEEVLKWYSEIITNHQTGNFLQKILGLRWVFDGVLAEVELSIGGEDDRQFNRDVDMDDNQSPGFYKRGVEKIFTKKQNKKLQKEVDRLRVYLNAIQHSKLEADESGYKSCIDTLAKLIKFCSDSNEEYPVELRNILGFPEYNLLFIIDISAFSLDIYDQIQDGLDFLAEALCRSVGHFDVCYINGLTCRYKSPLHPQKRPYIFNIQCNSSTDLLRPVVDIILRRESSARKNVVSFILSGDKNKCVCSSSEVSKILGIKPGFSYSVCVADPKDMSDKLYDMYAASDKIPKFFDWVKEVIQSNFVCGR